METERAITRRIKPARYYLTYEHGDDQEGEVRTMEIGNGETFAHRTARSFRENPTVGYIALYERVNIYGEPTGDDDIMRWSWTEELVSDEF